MQAGEASQSGVCGRRCWQLALLLCCALPLVGAACTHLQSQEPPIAPEGQPGEELAPAVTQARSLLTDLAKRAVGLSVAVASEGSVVWSEAYGYSDLESAQPATPDTLFRFYSLSKPMTAVAAARLLEEGSLDAEAPVQRYVPDFPDKGAVITPMQLAIHTSGIRHYANDDERTSPGHCASVADALAIFASDPLIHPPGEQETYSAWGYVLLSAVLEGASDLPYERGMADIVFEPLAMGATSIDDPTEESPVRASFYRESEPDQFRRAMDVDNTCKWGAGAWMGTAEDAARFGLALADDSLLQPETRQLFLQGETVYRAQGVGVGGAALLTVDDEADLSISLLSNAIGEALGPDLQRAAAELHAIFGSVAVDRDKPAPTSDD